MSEDTYLKGYFVYKLFLAVGLFLLLVGCSDHDSSSAPLVFEPIKISDIKYDDKNYIIELSMSDDIYVASKRDATVYVESVTPQGVHNRLAILSESNVSENYGRTIDTDGHYITVGEPSPDSFFVYKIEDNQSVSKLAKIVVVETSTSKTMAGDILVDAGTIAVPELRYSIDEETWSAIYDEKVLIYTIASDTNISKIQEIKSDRVDSNESTNFGSSISLDMNTLAISEACYVNFYTKKSDGTFEKIDSVLVDESKAEDDCSLYLELKDNHLVAYSHRYRTLYLYQLKDGKVISVQELTDASSPPKLGNQVAFIDDKLLLSSSEGLALYTMDDNESSVTVNKYMDINISADLLAAGDKYFVATNAYATDVLSLFDTYPLHQIYVYSDTNAKIDVDEGEVYTLYTLDANSPAGDLSYTLSGDDASYFKLEGTNLINVAPFDYENPTDVNLDNNYTLSIDISDSESKHTSVKLTFKVLDRDYMLETRVVANDNEEDKELGQSLSIDGNTLLVGAASSAYLFDITDTLTQVAKIVPNTTDIESSFGKSVAKSGNRLLVSAPNEDINDSYQGAVYLFNIDAQGSVEEKMKLTTSTLEAHTLFGNRVAMNGDLSIIGAPGNDLAYRHPGKIYLYKNEENGTMTLKETLESPQPYQVDSFGGSLALTSNYLIVGAYKNSINDKAFVGTVFLYKREADQKITLITSLEPTVITYEQYFGASVAMDGEYFLVSCPKDADVYVYKIDENEVKLLTTLHNENINGFGSDLSIHGRDIAITNNDYTNELIEHYIIEDDDSVTFKEVVQNHENIISSYYHKVVQGQDVLISGASLSSVGVKASGVVSLYKKEKN